MKNSDNDYNSGKSSTVDPPSARPMILRERNRLRNLDLREEGRNLNINGEEEIENSFNSELRSLKCLVAL